MVKSSNNRFQDKKPNKAGYQCCKKRLFHAFYLMLLCLPASISAKAQVPVALAPVPHIQFLDSSGRPLSAGCVSTFNAGSSTPAATYVDSGGVTQNTNPITLDAGGFADIWLAQQSYKIQVNAAPSSGVCSSVNLGTLQWTVDNVTAWSVLNQTNTWTNLQIFSGGINVAGTLASTGAITCKNLQSVRCVAGFPGSDWGTKVNNADADLGATAGELWIDQSAGLTNLTAISLSANHTLRFIQGGIYQTAKAITLGTNASIVGPPKGNVGAGGTFGGQAVIQETNSSNLPALIIMGTSSSLTDMVIYGNATNNPTEGAGVLTNALRTLIDGCTIQKFMTHGIFSSTGSSVTRILRSIITGNLGDGVYVLNTTNMSISSSSELTSNGLAGTVTTVGVNITETAGTPWSTDSSLVGTRVRVGTNLFTVASISDSTHLVLATSAGNHVGLALNWGNGIEFNNSSNGRVNQTKVTLNGMDGILGYGTTAGGGTSNIQVASSFFQDQFQNDIEVVGYDPVGAGNVAFGWVINGNQFAGAQFRTPDNTYDSIILQDGGQHTVTGNSISSSPSPNTTRYGINLTETAPNQALPSYVSGNTFGNIGALVATTITAATEATNTVTLTFASNPIIKGQTVIVTGVTPTGYNGTFYVTSATGTTITYYDPTAGLGAGSIFGAASATPTFGTATFIDQNANAANGIAGQIQAPIATGDIICGTATNPPRWADCLNGGPNSLVTFVSAPQNGTLASTPVVASTASDGFWVFSGVITISAVTGTPTAVVNVGNCGSGTINLSGGPYVFFAVDKCNAQFFTASSSINVIVTVTLGGGTVTYTATVHAKFID